MVLLLTQTRYYDIGSKIDRMFYNPEKGAYPFEIHTSEGEVLRFATERRAGDFWRAEIDRA